MQATNQKIPVSTTQLKQQNNRMKYPNKKNREQRKEAQQIRDRMENYFSLPQKLGSNASVQLNQPNGQSTMEDQ